MKMDQGSADPDMWTVTWPGKPYPSGLRKVVSLPRWLARLTWPIRRRRLVRK